MKPSLLSNSLDKRRYSMPRLLDDSDDNEEDSSTSKHHPLVRSPSDTSLYYLSQLSTYFPANVVEDIKPSLPSKKRPRARLAAPQVQSAAALEEQQCYEAIYDCLPTPRSCLNEEQIRFNEIYDVPRNLLIPQAKVTPDSFPRSMSAFGTAQVTPRQSDCISVCSVRSGRGLLQPQVISRELRACPSTLCVHLSVQQNLERKIRKNALLKYLERLNWTKSYKG